MTRSSGCVTQAPAAKPAFSVYPTVEAGGRATKRTEHRRCFEPRSKPIPIDLYLNSEFCFKCDGSNVPVFPYFFIAAINLLFYYYVTDSNFISGM